MIKQIRIKWFDSSKSFSIKNKDFVDLLKNACQKKRTRRTRMSYASHPKIYSMLKKTGNNAAKAAEIMLDAGRGDKHARKWIVAVFKGR